MPGECGDDDAGPLAERLEDRLSQLLGNAGPVVLDHDQDAVALGLDPEPDRAIGLRVAGRVHQEVLDDPLDLRGIHRDHDRFGEDHDRAVGEGVEALDRASRERADVGHAVLRVDDPSVEPVDVEQVLQQAVELAGVRGEPLEQIVAVVLDHLRAFEGERQPQDRGERAAQLVRDRGEERVLHVVECSQSFGGLALTLLRLAERVLGQLPLGDVGHHAEQHRVTRPRRRG